MSKGRSKLDMGLYLKTQGLKRKKGTRLYRRLRHKQERAKANLNPEAPSTYKQFGGYEL